ncbi:transcriptional regulator [Niveispirillum lacus]|uniref:Transcriptional regulator n=1 Tax=Niveispirillum lacus TaxID=1981099 RepID=A0A255Z7Y9_9PROT|nr:winged helix DNA-binding protein [Niveispirillum lacus]OYQ36995.1 transcriptional regulator [Niveispirillum lacus]
MSEQPKTPIVSSAHLAQGGSPALSELEFSLTLAASAFQRWIVRCAAVAGAQLTPLEVLILHTVRHRGRPKRFVDIMLVLHIEDAHLANYALRKLQGAGLVRTKRVGKEKLVEVTEAGVTFCETYKQVREQLLVDSLQACGISEEALSQSAARLRALSGIYGEAARAAATL